MDYQKYMNSKEYTEQKPWRCAGCLAWNWVWRPQCRVCSPQSFAECYRIGDDDDDDDDDYVEDYYSNSDFSEGICEEDFHYSNSDFSEGICEDYYSNSDFSEMHRACVEPALVDEWRFETAGACLGGNINEAVATVPAYFNDFEDKGFRQKQMVLKHGKVSMLATLGYLTSEGCITPELVGKIFDYVPPSTGIKFADVPNGLADYEEEYFPVREDGGTVVAEGHTIVADGKKVARSAMKDPEVELKLSDASYDAEYLPYQMKFDSPHGRYDGTIVAEGDCLALDGQLARSAMKDPEVAPKLANANYDAEHLAHQMKFDSIHGRHDGTNVAEGDSRVIDGKKMARCAMKDSEAVPKLQDPGGFWDPAGFTADDNVEHFQHRHQTDLKRSRLPMPATLGYITPELAGKLPGDLSPSMDIKFADIPNGLAAFSTDIGIGKGRCTAQPKQLKLHAGGQMKQYMGSQKYMQCGARRLYSAA